MTTRVTISNFADLTAALRDEFVVGRCGDLITLGEVLDWVALAAARERDAVDVPITVDLDALLECSHEMELYEGGEDPMSARRAAPP